MTMPEREIGIGSTTFPPPEAYWDALAAELPDQPVAALREKSDARLNAFRPSDLPPPRQAALGLLERVAADGWVVKKVRHECPNCQFELTKDEAAGHVCPDCNEQYFDHGGVVEEVVFERDVPTRQVDWVVAIHGMNTKGEWQEEFSWYFSTTWGRSVPVSVYKYGIVIAGVLMPWRRRTLQTEFREKFAKLREQAEARSFSGKPDVIAHSFGTWLLGHMLEDELDRPEEERLRVGRIILTGSVIRPDFDWRRLKDAGIVEEILCHYGSKDPIVPLAHYAIVDSGPSGRRGFDGDEVINVVAEGFGHSDLFSVEKCVVAGKSLQVCTGGDKETRQLDDSYQRVWRPFLQLSAEEFAGLPDRRDPPTPWRQAPWFLRGTVLPFFLLPLVAIALLVAVGLLGKWLWPAAPLLGTAAKACLAGLLALFSGFLLTGAWRRLRPSKHSES